MFAYSSEMCPLCCWPAGFARLMHIDVMCTFTVCILHVVLFKDIILSVCVFPESQTSNILAVLSTVNTILTAVFMGLTGLEAGNTAGVISEKR